MQYLIENAYTKKLYSQLKRNMINLQVIKLSEVAMLQPGYDCIIDASDYDCVQDLFNHAREVIVLSDKNRSPSEQSDNVRYILKFQSTKNILTLMAHVAFPITFLGFVTPSTKNKAIIETVSKKYVIDTIISLDFSPNSRFSLFDSLTREDDKIVNHARLDVITNIQDYLNPPTLDLIQYLNQLKAKCRLLIVSSCLKGMLDGAIVDLADTIILIENDPTIKLEPYLKHILMSKNVEVVHDDTLY